MGCLLVMVLVAFLSRQSPGSANIRATVQHVQARDIRERVRPVMVESNKHSVAKCHRSLAEESSRDTILSFHCGVAPRSRTPNTSDSCVFDESAESIHNCTSNTVPVPDDYGCYHPSESTTDGGELLDDTDVANGLEGPGAAWNLPAGELDFPDEYGEKHHEFLEAECRPRLSVGFGDPTDAYECDNLSPEHHLSSTGLSGSPMS